jgi:hypothetical protein
MKKAAAKKISVPDMRLIPVEEIEPNGWNPNEMSNDEFDALVQEIRDVGFIQPVQVVPMVDGSFRLLGGEHRWKAAKTLGMYEIPAVILSEIKWQEEDLQKLVTVRLNHLHGKTNAKKMIPIYQEMEAKYGEKALQKLFAWTEEDSWKKFLKQMKKTVKNAMPKHVADAINDRLDDSDTVEDIRDILNTIMNHHGDTLQYSFLVFSFGSKEHVYVTMTKKTKAVLDKVLTFCKEWGKDMNEILPGLTEAWLQGAEEAEKKELTAQVPAKAS